MAVETGRAAPKRDAAHVPRVRLQPDAQAARRAIPGLAARGTLPDDICGDEIRGSTTILELLRRYPGGEAATLMARIQFPCAHCGGAVREPLTLAAKRHRRDPRAVLEAFRALERGGPDAALVSAATERRPELWQRA
ncbi:MAG TPA: hypothetical protein VH572_08950 [Gaiella sp.]